jgi:hypothetical protein
MIKIWKNLLVGGFVFVLVACEKKPAPLSPVLYEEKPRNLVGSLCGTSCEKCNSDVHTCLSFLQENLSTLCDNSKDNCYVLWTRYVKDCRSLCSETVKKSRAV